MRCRLLAALLSLTLTGCGDGGSRAPFAESRTPPSIAPRFYALDGWAWGFVRVGDGPVQRYGVSAPPVGPRATIVILPGYGEPAEKWFETVRTLNHEGYTVWVLERQGQGGSERLTPWRDVGHVVSFDADAEVVRALVNVVIRPKDNAPLILMGHSAGALVALRASQAGAPNDGLILSSLAFEIDRLPAPKAQILPIAQWASRLKLGWLKDPREPGWRRDGPDGVGLGVTSDKVRGAVQQAWLTANPDLRMGSPSLGWLAAFYDASENARADAGRITVPVLLLDTGKPNSPQARSCEAMSECREVSFPAGRSEFHMETDLVRDAWLVQIDTFLRARIAAKAQARKAAPGAQPHAL